MNTSFKKQFAKISHIYNAIVGGDPNSKKWHRLKNAFAGQRAFLVGNGPSLNETPLYLLKNENTMCFNRFYMLDERLSWNAKFYMCVDPLVLPDISSEINKELDKFEYPIFLSEHKQYIKESEKTLFIHGVVPNLFSTKLPVTGKAYTVAFQAIQVLNYLGFSPIYLIGVDQNYQVHKTAKVNNGREIESVKDDDPNHFDPRYFGKGAKYHQPDQEAVDAMLNCFKIAKEASVKHNFEIYNAGYNSNLNIFERKMFEDLFDIDEDEKFALFLECFPKNITGEFIKSLLARDCISDYNDELPTTSSFVADTNFGKKLIQKIVFSHIPFGPYNGKIVFLNRDLVRAVV